MRQAQVLVHMSLDGTVSKCRAAVALEGLADNSSLRCSPVHSPVLCASPPSYSAALGDPQYITIQHHSTALFVSGTRRCATARAQHTPAPLQTLPR